MKLFAVTLLLALGCGSAWPQVADLRGDVVDSHGDAIAGAVVTCKLSPSTSTRTDLKGSFSLGCPSSAVVVSAPGFRTQAFDGKTPMVLSPSAVGAAVTVSRTSTIATNSPLSVICLDRTDLRLSGTLTLDERLRQIPGFTLFRRAGSSVANPTTQGVSLRGVGASGASRALVVNDGVPINDPFGGWVYWGRVPEESISSVELIRGPASDLYGSSAVGGVISIVDRESASSPFADLDLAFGSGRSPFVSFFGGSGGKRFRGSLAAEMYRTDGFIPTAPEARGAVDTVANVSRYSLRPRFAYARGNSLKAFAESGLYQERRRNGSPQQNNDTRIVDLTLGIDYTTRAGMFSGRVYGLTEKYHQSFSAIAANRQTEALNRLQTVPSQALGVNGQWTGSWKKQVVYAGADVRQIRGRSDETAIANGIATSLSTSGGRETSFGSFAGAIFDRKRFTLGAGVRYDAWWNSRGFSATRPITVGLPTLTLFADRSESRLSPRVSLLTRFGPHVSVSGLFSTAFRQPTLNELYRSFRVGNVLTLANDTLTAERATSGEAAVIVNALNDRLYLRAGPFCTSIDNTVSNVTLSATPALITRQRQNLGTTRSCGIESDLRLDPSAEWSLTTGYLFVNSVIISMPGNGALVGLQLPQVAKDQFTTNLRYSPHKIGTFAIQFRTSSSQWDDDLNTLRLGSYASLDVFGSHRLSDRATAYFAAENITNSRIESGRTPVLTLAPGRAIRVGLRLGLGKR
jgi:outer membrane receptor protein involved in Fe transport